MTDQTVETGPLARRRLLMAALAWLIALSALGFMVRANLTNLPRFRLVDLDVYRDGGRSVLQGGPLYSMHSRIGLVFTYPPAAAVLAVPLALMSWPAAQLLWILMVYIPLGITIGYAFRPVLARAGRYGPAVFAGAFLCCAWLVPMRQEIQYGQVDILLVSLCILDCGARQPRWPRGLLIGLATAIKLVPGVFIVYLLMTGRRKAAAVAAGTFVVVSGLAWAISPQDSERYWSSAIFNPKRLGPNVPTANQSVRGMILRIFYPAPVPAAVWLGIAAIVAVAGFAAARHVRGRGQEIAGIAITGMLAALLSPVAWFHHLCWVVVALGVIIGDGRSPRRAAIAAATVAMFAVSLPNWGKWLFLTHSVPVLLGRLLEDTFGLAAVALIVIMLAIPPADTDVDLVPAAGRHGRPVPVAQRVSPAGSRDG